MKLITTILASMIVCASNPKDKIQWDKTEHDFGTIRQGEIVTTEFKFINASDTFFQIENVLTSCGCTATEWNKGKVSPKDSGIVKVTFNSTGKSKQHEKVVSVLSSHGEYDLIIKANIIKP